MSIDSTSKRPVVYACIAALNEERMIGRIILLTRKHVDQVFVCDDGSIDLTGDLAKSLGAFVIRHESNTGKGTALRDLFEEVLKDVPDAVVVLDADGQHDPEYIPEVLKPILSGEADMVIGSRYMEGSKTDAPLYRRLGLRLFNGHNMNGVHDTQSGFRAFSGKALKVIAKSKANGFGMETEQIALAASHGLRMMEVPIEVRYVGLERTSKMNPIQHGAQIIITMVRLVTEERPLSTLGIPAVIAVILGAGSGVWMMMDYNANRNFNISLWILAIAGIFIGMMMGISALMLYAISRIKTK